MRTRSSAFFFLLTLVFAGCDRSTEPDAGYLEIREVTVGPTLAKCYGVGLQSCMVVDGKFFYDGIEGFEYEAGYDYRLRIGKYDPWDGEEPPQDAGLYAYRLLEQLEKTPAPSTLATLSVGPTRVLCAQNDDFCLVVDGAPYDDMITSFEYEAGHHYILEANRYGDGRYVLSEVVSQTKAAGTEEEITIEAPQGRVRRWLSRVLQGRQRRPLSRRDRGLPALARLRLPPARPSGSACFPTV